MSSKPKPKQPRKIIQAAQILQEIKNGQPVRHKHAQIEGAINLRAMTISQAIELENVIFVEPLDFSYATFAQVLNLNDCTFQQEVKSIGAKCERDLWLDNTIFEGSANFSNLMVGGDCHAESAVFQQEAYFYEAHFQQGIDFDLVVFGGAVDFETARIGGNANFTQSIFKGKANFTDVHIILHGNFHLATFHQGCDFSNASIGGNGTYVGCQFHKYTSFNSLRVSRNLFFRAWLFKTSFTSPTIGPHNDMPSPELLQALAGNNIKLPENIRVQSRDNDIHEIVDQNNEPRLRLVRGATEFTVFAVEPTTFHGMADFAGAHMGFVVEMADVEFRDNATFYLAQVDGSVFFDKSTFSGTAYFVHMKIAHNGSFAGVSFRKSVSFDGLRIGESLFFNDFHLGSIETGDKEVYNSLNSQRIPARLHQLFDHYRQLLPEEYKISVQEQKSRWVVEELANGTTRPRFYISINRRTNKLEVSRSTQFNAEASFPIAQVDGDIYFNNVAFTKNTQFRGMTVGGMAFFLNTIFENGINFSNTTIKGEISFYGSQFMGYLNLTNSVFRTIDLRQINLDEDATINMLGCIYFNLQPHTIWKTLIKHFTKPYSRQPFIQLEETLQRTGHLQEAVKVYLTRKQNEAPFSPLRPLTGYGVRLWYLLGWSALFVYLGTKFFLLEGAIEPTKDALESFATIPAISWLDALSVSLNYFLPIETATGALWQASPRFLFEGEWISLTSLEVATILQILGWIFIPLGIAGLSGLLKRE